MVTNHFEKNCFIGDQRESDLGIAFQSNFRIFCYTTQYAPVYINIDCPMFAVSAISIRVPQPIFYFILVSVTNVSVTFVCHFHTKFLVFTCLPCVIPLHLIDPNPQTPNRYASCSQHTQPHGSIEIVPVFERSVRQSSKHKML